MCYLKIKCSKCNKWIRWFVKADREKAIKAHDCNQNVTYRHSCQNYYDPIDDSILEPKTQKQWEVSQNCA